eukprot:3647231-Rhodomonas_salina.1
MNTPLETSTESDGTSPVSIGCARPRQSPCGRCGRRCRAPPWGLCPPRTPPPDACSRTPGTAQAKGFQLQTDEQCNSTGPPRKVRYSNSNPGIDKSDTQALDSTSPTRNPLMMFQHEGREEEYRVLVDAVGGDGEEVCLLQVDVGLCGKGVQERQPRRLLPSHACQQQHTPASTTHTPVSHSTHTCVSTSTHMCVSNNTHMRVRQGGHLEGGRP